MISKPTPPTSPNPLRVGHSAPSLPTAQPNVATAEEDYQDDTSSYITFDAATELGKMVYTPAVSELGDRWIADMAGYVSTVADRAHSRMSKLSDSLSMSEAVRQVTKGLSIRFICVCGLSGAGKSSFIKLATGASVHVEHSIKSGTSTFAMFPATIAGERFVFVDTPGFDDRYKSDLEILEVILEWFEIMTPYVDLAGVVYVHDITKDRFGGAADLNLELIRAMAGTRFYSRIMFVTTKWDMLVSKSVAKAQARQRQLEEDPWKDMIDAGAQVCMLDGVDEADGPAEVEAATAQVRKMMEYYTTTKNKARAQIQKELRRKVPRRETLAALVVLGTSSRTEPPEYEEDTQTARELREAVPLLKTDREKRAELKKQSEQEKKKQEDNWWGSLVHAVLSFFGIRR